MDCRKKGTALPERAATRRVEGKDVSSARVWANSRNFGQRGRHERTQPTSDQSRIARTQTQTAEVQFGCIRLQVELVADKPSHATVDRCAYGVFGICHHRRSNCPKWTALLASRRPDENFGKASTYREYLRDTTQNVLTLCSLYVHAHSSSSKDKTRAALNRFAQRCLTLLTQQVPHDV